MAVLLDTNAWIVYLKNEDSKVRQRLTEVEPNEVFVCSIVKAELFHGAMKYGKPDQRRAVLVELLAPYSSVPFED